MCQQWFSVVGLILDVCGFLLIAREWWHVFQHSILLRQDAMEEDCLAQREGEEAVKKRRRAKASMWRNTQLENRIDNARRQKLFLSGMVLVVLGFLGQLIGNLPYSQSFFRFTSCS
jgi:predicted Holliday junction resolvase-like endonuclease